MANSIDPSQMSRAKFQGYISAKVCGIEKNQNDQRTELRNFITKVEIKESQQNSKINEIEKEIEKTKTHFKWMFGILTFLWGGLLWLGKKYL